MIQKSPQKNAHLLRHDGCKESIANANVQASHRDVKKPAANSRRDSVHAGEQGQLDQSARELLTRL